jgi:hypothetical protein
MTATLDLSRRIAIRPDVLARNVGDETVILDLASGTYFGLDPVGARVWTLSQRGRSLGEICDTLVAEYDVARERLEADVARLAGELSRAQLVDLVDAG